KCNRCGCWWALDWECCRFGCINRRIIFAFATGIKIPGGTRRSADGKKPARGAPGHHHGGSKNSLCIAEKNYGDLCSGGVSRYIIGGDEKRIASQREWGRVKWRCSPRIWNCPGVLPSATTGASTKYCWCPLPCWWSLALW